MQFTNRIRQLSAKISTKLTATCIWRPVDISCMGVRQQKRPAARSGMMRTAGLQTSGRPVETDSQDASLPPLGTVAPTLPLQSV